MRKFIAGLLIAIAALIGADAVMEEPLLSGFRIIRSSAAVIQRVVTLSSTSFSEFSNPASQSLVLVPDPGDNCAIELISVTGMRIFASEAWQNVDEGFEVKYENRTGLSVIATFSKGFSSGGSANTVASPSWVIRYPVDTMASPSEPLILTASTSQTIDGDTTFKFSTSYRKVCSP